MNYEKIGNFVKKHRKAMDLTQKELAERSGVSHRTISSIEKGTKVYLDTLRKVLNYFGYDLNITDQNKTKIIDL